MVWNILNGMGHSKWYGTNGIPYHVDKEDDTGIKSIRITFARLSIKCKKDQKKRKKLVRILRIYSFTTEAKMN